MSRYKNDKGFQKETYNIVVIGAGGVGKSALTIQFIQSYFVQDYDPTIEDFYSTQVMVDCEPARLDVLDTAGQDHFSVMREQYMRAGDGFILAFSVTDVASYAELGQLHAQILRVKERHAFPMLLVGNKVDLASGPGGRRVMKETAEAQAEHWQCPYMETSAKTRQNVDEVFQELVRQIRRHRAQLAVNSRSKKKGSTSALRMKSRDAESGSCLNMCNCFRT